MEVIVPDCAILRTTQQVPTPTRQRVPQSTMWIADYGYDTDTVVAIHMIYLHTQMSVPQGIRYDVTASTMIYPHTMVMVMVMEC